MSPDIIKPRLLVVEDEFDLRDLLRIVLTRAGYEVTLAADGLEALALCTASRFDGIILDLAMPKLDGFGFLEQRPQAARDVPVLVLTARHVGESVERATALGATDYIPKPFDAQVLLRRVRKAFRPDAGAPELRVVAG
jgi:DNA-binding response OmpR family regulator